jgi:hypothetical protein
LFMLGCLGLPFFLVVAFLCKISLPWTNGGSLE